MNLQPQTTLCSPPGRNDCKKFSSFLLLASLLLGVNIAFAANQLTQLVIPDLSPTFNPNTKQYSITRTASCSVPVTATLADTSLKLYIASTETASGATRQAWVCDGKTKIDVVVYQNWTEVDRYTVNVVDNPNTPPPPPPVSGKLSQLAASGLSPAFNPDVTQYTVPTPSNCSIAVTATTQTQSNANLKLYVGGTPTTSGATVNAWVCNGKTKVDVIIFDVWKEVGRYTITPSGTPSQTPSPTPTPTPTPVVAEPTPQPEPAPALPAYPAQATASATQALQFLEHASFGVKPLQMTAVQSVGIPYWMAQQAHLAASPIDDNLDINALLSQSFLNMYQGEDQLRQRMMFALSQILVVSANKNIYGNELVPYVKLLSKHAFGNYRSLLREMSLSPSMGKYLDLANSRKATATTSPNENYARELMQLFTIGLYELNQDGSTKLDALGQPIPTYSQQTLREVAKALTGWTYPTKPNTERRTLNNEYFVGLMEPRPESHDLGSKTLLNGAVVPANQSVTQDLDAVIDNLFNHPNLPPFIAARLIRSLTLSAPSPQYIQRVADVFANNGQGVRGDLWATLVAVLTDSEANSAPSPDKGRLKDPLLHVMSLGRALNASIADPNQFMYIFRGLGEQVLTPPTVFGFYSPLAKLPGHPDVFAPEFQIYSPGLAIQRANFIYQLLTNQLGASFSFDATAFNAVADDPTALVELVNQTLLHGNMSNALRQTLIAVTQVTQGTQNRVVGALYLTAISSEFSVQEYTY